MWTQWLLAGPERRELMWPLYGRFTALLACGSVLGTVAWSANIGNYYYEIVANKMLDDLQADAPDYSIRRSQIQTMFALSNYWWAAWMVVYALEFPMVCVAKLTVLFRMLEFAAPRASGELRHRLALFLRVVMAVVILGSVVGFCGNAAAASAAVTTAHFFTQAATAYASNSTAQGFAFENQASAQNSHANMVISVQQFSEVVVLLIIILAFFVAGTLCARRLMASKIDHSKLSRLIRQIFATIAVIFITFLLRSVFATLNAVTQLLQNSDIATLCGLCRIDPIVTATGSTPCNNVFSVIQNWIIFTPEFELLVVLISSPLSLLVSLWGMTSDNTRRILNERKLEGKVEASMGVIDQSFRM